MLSVGSSGSRISGFLVSFLVHLQILFLVSLVYLIVNLSLSPRGIHEHVSWGLHEFLPGIYGFIHVVLERLPQRVLCGWGVVVYVHL